MNKVFLIRAAFGNYDSYSSKIIKVFENEEEAIEYSEKYDRIIKNLSDFVSECWNVVSDKDYSNDKSYKNCVHHALWSKYHIEFEEYNGVDVVEMPLIEHRRKKSLKTLLD